VFKKLNAFLFICILCDEKERKEFMKWLVYEVYRVIGQKKRDEKQ